MMGHFAERLFSMGCRGVLTFFNGLNGNGAFFMFNVADGRG
jgi:hypothetical protein